MAGRAPSSPPRARRRRRPRKRPLTPEELHARELGRAWRCGARYARNRWVRRSPPRWRKCGVCDPLFERELAVRHAFYRGYDAAERERYRHAAGVRGISSPLRAEARP